MINQIALRAAQNKIVIARFLGDGEMWKEAMNAARDACDVPSGKSCDASVLRMIVVKW